MHLRLVISSLNNSQSKHMILARFDEQVIMPDFQAFGQVDRKFNNSFVLCRFAPDASFKIEFVKFYFHVKKKQ